MEGDHRVALSPKLQSLVHLSQQLQIQETTRERKVKGTGKKLHWSRRLVALLQLRDNILLQAGDKSLKDKPLWRIRLRGNIRRFFPTVQLLQTNWNFRRLVNFFPLKPNAKTSFSNYFMSDNRLAVYLFLKLSTSFWEQWITDSVRALFSLSRSLPHLSKCQTCLHHAEKISDLSEKFYLSNNVL